MPKRFFGGWRDDALHHRYHPNEILAGMIAEAWTSETGFRNKILAFVDDATGVPLPVVPGRPNPEKLKTVAMEFETRSLDFQKPVVLTEEQYRNGYVSEDEEETIFVLPDPPTVIHKGAHAVETARVRMAVTACGM